MADEGWTPRGDGSHVALRARRGRGDEPDAVLDTAYRAAWLFVAVATTMLVAAQVTTGERAWTVGAELTLSSPAAAVDAAAIAPGTTTPRSAAMKRRGWHAEGPADPKQNIELTFMLKQQNTDQMYEMAMAVSDPTNALYGKHLPLDAIGDLIRPADETTAAVGKWLADNGVPDEAVKHNPNGDVVSVTVPVATAEKLLHAKYLVYSQDAASNATVPVSLRGNEFGKPAPADAKGKKATRKVIRTESFELPAALKKHIDWVGPTMEFPTMPSIVSVRSKAEAQAARAATATAAQGLKELDLAVTPMRIKHLYGISPKEMGGASALNKQAAVGFFNEKLSEEDLQAFFKAYSPDLVGTMPVMETKASTGDGMETMLDVEYMMSIGGKIPTEFWYFPGRSPSNAENEPFLKWLQVVGAVAKIPSVFSVSYADWEGSVDPAYAERVNKELAKLALRGVSVFVATGDGGVEGAQHLPHSAWPGHICDPGDDFIPSFPASSPWVTSVGATQRDPTSLGGDFKETAALISAGGFSNYFPMPDYQKDAVAGYFKSRAYLEAVGFFSLPATDKALWNMTGRAFPDVSALGMDISIIFGGRKSEGCGTSAATPMIAAMVALVNDARLAEKKPPLGFINPILYQDTTRSAFTDITSGSNPGCGTNGFPAAVGWDPVTGMGSIHFEHFKSALMKVAGNKDWDAAFAL